MSRGKPEVSEETKKTCTKTLVHLMQRNLTTLFYKNAYIVTNGCMMIWSIIYHSWLGFILLIWANLIWIRKDQRAQMMKSSPYLVVYALILLFINYIYGMNFTEDELPTQAGNMNMNQIGFVKYEAFPGVSLLIKSTFTVSFWITMRLMFQEKLLKKQKKNLTFDESVRLMMKKDKKELPKSSSKVMTFIENFCMFSFMWIIVLTLFLMGIYGEEMSLSRIINMSFCLVYFLLFHVSFKLWLNSMYIFWTTLIFYAVSALVLIYGYQFDDFLVFPFQDEIGLRKYETGMLFMKLLSFTLVILLTGLQMNKFHDKFIEYFANKQNMTKMNVGETSTDKAETVRKF